METIMKKCLFVLLILFLVSGCGSSVSSKLKTGQIKGKDVYIATIDNNPHFSIITDGSVSGRVVHSVGVKYGGEISFGYENRITFTAKNNQMKIEGQMFTFEEGAVFLVSYKDKLQIKCINDSENAKLQSLIQTDQRVITFFNR
jgi:hypothetical protein